MHSSAVGDVHPSAFSDAAVTPRRNTPKPAGDTTGLAVPGVAVGLDGATLGVAVGVGVPVASVRTRRVNARALPGSTASHFAYVRSRASCSRSSPPERLPARRDSVSHDSLTNAVKASSRS